MKHSLISLTTTAALGLAGLIGPLLGGVTDTVDGVVDTATDTVTAVAGTATGVVATVIDAPVLDDGRALVHVAEDADLDAVADAAADAGLEATRRYEAIDVFHAVGSAAALEDLAERDDVVRLEHDRPIEILTDTSHEATGGARLVAGEVDELGAVDGDGVGVAVVDTGVDGLHPDLNGRVGENVKVLPGGIAIPFPDTDLLSLGGHGTHVAGTVAGTGSASNGTYTGAAPGTTVHGVSAGTLVLMHSGLDALDWVLANHDQVTPEIRVVNNSWGSQGEHDPDGAVTAMVDELVEAGVLVVFAAGNAGGDGGEVQTSPECTNPTEGVVCVAAYDDLDEGTTEGATADFSSRGDQDRPETWPDLAAPGAEIVAACRPTLPVCLTGALGVTDPLHYASMSGTSMAAPHVAGIAGQILQLDPDLAPAEVQQLLVDTAHDYGDPAHAQGAGLVDAVAAARAAADGGQRVSRPGAG